MERAGHTGSSVLPFCEYTLGVANASCLCFWIGSLFGYCYPHCYWNLQQKKHIWLIEFGSGRYLPFGLNFLWLGYIQNPCPGMK